MKTITLRSKIKMESLVHLFLFNILFRQNQRPSRTLHSEISLQFYSIRSSVNFNSVKSSQDVSLLQANEVWGQVMFLHVCHSVGGGGGSVCHFLSGCLVPCSFWGSLSLVPCSFQGVSALGVYPPESEKTGGTHPTVMLSC